MGRTDDMGASVGEWLRGLEVFAGPFADFDPAGAPAEPPELFIAGCARPSPQAAPMRGCSSSRTWTPRLAVRRARREPEGPPTRRSSPRGADVPLADARMPDPRAGHGGTGRPGVERRRPAGPRAFRMCRGAAERSEHAPGYAGRTRQRFPYGTRPDRGGARSGQSGMDALHRRPRDGRILAGGRGPDAHPAALRTRRSPRPVGAPPALAPAFCGQNRLPRRGSWS